MSINVAIITTTKRPSHLAEGLMVETIGMKPKVFDDTEGIGCTENHLRAWDYLAEQATEWSLVLEDDAMLCQGFDHQLREVLCHSPGPVVSLYLGQGRPPQWQRKAARAVATRYPYIACTTLLHAVAVAVRTDWLTGDRGMMPAARVAAHEGGKPIDEAVTEWVKSQAIPVFYSNPSIVDHNVSVPSVAEHTPHEEAFQGARVAHYFGTRTGRAHWYPGIAIM